MALTPEQEQLRIEIGELLQGARDDPNAINLKVSMTIPIASDEVASINRSATLLGITFEDFVAGGIVVALKELIRQDIHRRKLQ